MWQSKRSLILSIIFLAIVLPAYLLLTPPSARDLVSHPRPARTYAEAVERIRALQSREADGMKPECRLQFLTHGRRVNHAIVFVHGYTNCPQQFAQLGTEFFRRGWNVLIAPLPHHGLKDRMTGEHERLNAQELVRYADETVDIAQGLGKRVVMTGISAGGVATAYAAQYRNDIDRAVIISPALGFKRIPGILTVPVTGLLLSLPNHFAWWDPSRKAQASTDHSYPRYSTHALGQILRLGNAVREAGTRMPPAAHSVTIVQNAGDTDINNDLIDSLADAWRQRHPQRFTIFRFAADLHLVHDLIDPAESSQRTEFVYPRLMDLILH